MQLYNGKQYLFLLSHNIELGNVSHRQSVFGKFIPSDVTHKIDNNQFMLFSSIRH